MTTSILCKEKISVKFITYAVLTFAAISLPQLVHLTVGAAGGKMLLPMYLPVLVAGCIMGSTWGVAAGVASPLISYAITTLMGYSMPALAILPIMSVELAVFGLVSGLWSKKITSSAFFAIPAVICSQIAGRGLVVLFGALNGTVVASLNQVTSSWKGMLLQLVLVPLVAFAVKALTQKNND